LDQPASAGRPFTRSCRIPGQRVEQIYEASRGIIEQFNIGTGYLFATVGLSGFVVEPVFFWPDALTEIHHHYVESEHLGKIEGFAASPEARAAVLSLRQQLIDLFHEMGAAHLQVGKSYRYRESLGEAGRTVVTALKKAVDPTGQINPGSLGFD
jgi:hypothetical protein